MERDVPYIAVAVVVLGLLAAFGGFLLWQWEGAAGDDARVFTVAVEGDVGGLEAGSAVRYLGMRVGRVREIGLADGSIGTVEVRIGVAEGTPVNSSTIARIQPEGITGRSYLSLATREAEAPPLGADGTAARITSEPSDLDRALASAPEVLERLAGAAAGIEALVGPENRAHTRRLLEQVAVLSSELSAATARMEQLGARAQGTLAGVDEALDEASATLRAVRGPLPALERTLVELEALGSEASALLAATRPAARHVREQTLYELDALLAESRATVDQVHALARHLREDPSRLIYRAPERGVELPQ